MSTWSASFGSASVGAMEVYDDVLVPGLFTPWAELLLDELALQPGEAVLDVACGPGSVTRLAAGRVGPAGRVTGCDLSAAMLAIARAKPAASGAAPIDYVEAPADALPVASESFDVALCQQGLQFFPDRPAALAELHRALRPGGRLGIAVWTRIDESPVFAALGGAVRAVAGDELADRYGAGPWGFPDADALGALIAAAGFTDVRVERRSVDVAFEGGAARFASTLAASGIAPEVAALPADRQSQLVQAFEDGLRSLDGDGTVRSSSVSNVAVARR